jgi:hypothetical protein
MGAEHEAERPPVERARPPRAARAHGEDHAQVALAEGDAGEVEAGGGVARVGVRRRVEAQRGGSGGRRG